MNWGYYILYSGKKIFTLEFKIRSVDCLYFTVKIALVALTGWGGGAQIRARFPGGKTWAFAVDAIWLEYFFDFTGLRLANAKVLRTPIFNQFKL